MVTQLGFCKSLGQVAWSSGGGSTFLGGSMAQPSDFSMQVREGDGGGGGAGWGGAVCQSGVLRNSGCINAGAWDLQCMVKCG